MQIDKRKEALELARMAAVCRKVMLHDDSGDWDTLDRAEELVFRSMAILNNVALTDDSWVGRTYVEQAADGQAFYVVLDVLEGRQLVFAHLPIGDAWESPLLEQWRKVAPWDDVLHRLASWTVYVPRMATPMTKDEFSAWEKQFTNLPDADIV